MVQVEVQETWTVAEAKARLSEVLRLAEEEGPQRIGVRKPCIVVPEHIWQERAPERRHMGRWLVENMPRGLNLELPDRSETDREIPFLDWDKE